ncbi:MAG: DNRLRE domain-containing protein, partial [Thermoplasmata archaeon]|nr:DNRLRE domain-containing protein [Thermoplasmata archaeon]
MKRIWKRAIAFAIVVSLVLPATVMLLTRNAEAQPIVLQPSLMDTSIDQALPDTTSGQSTTIDVTSSPNNNVRILIKFDLTGVTIPAGDEVTSATLDLDPLYIGEGPGDFDNPRDVDAYRVRTYWGEYSATWHKEPDYASERTSSSTTHSWDVTNVVKEWLS